MFLKRQSNIAIPLQFLKKIDLLFSLFLLLFLFVS